MSRLTATLEMPGVEDPVIVHALRGREAVSEAFRYEVDFSAPDVSPDDARGAVASLRIEDAEGNQRPVSGVVESLSVAARAGDFPRMRAVLVPLPALIKHRHGFRIFQDLDATQIVAKVFKDAGLPDKAFRWSLAHGYRKRAYCVQYDETEWAFVCRLLEDEGIWFAFDQTADGHVMLFSDDSTTAKALDPQELGFHFDAGAHGNHPFAWAWKKRAKTSVRKVVMRDYDQLRPSLDMTVSAEIQGDDHGSVREWYEYPGGYDDPQYGKRLAQIRLEELQSDRVTGRAKTNAIWLQAGRVFSLVGHPLDDGDHFLRSIDWALRLDDEQGEGALVDAGGISNVLELETMPKLRPFRPARATPRPIITGLQTATVTGPPGEEIHCDDLGRVKVQFAWDREGKLDDKTSCWMRVSQPQTPGAFLLPRIGWEVLVEFVEGNPDRPVCQGRMFNPKYTPVVALPENKTVTFHRSDSSPGGGGVNGVMMDDAAGRQRFALHAERQYNISVANDTVSRTGHNEQLGVGGDRTEHVGGDETMTVTGDSNLKVGADETITVGGTRTVKADGHINEQVKGNLKIKVGAATTIQVGSPAAAILQMAEAAATGAVAATAGNAMAQVEAAVAGPVLPALAQAREVLGTASQFAGPASGLLGDAPGAALIAAAGGLNIVPTPEAVGAIAAGAAVSAGVGAAGGGGGGGGGDGAGSGGAAGGGGGAGTGNWAVTVGGNVKELIGGLAAINTVGPAIFNVGASSAEAAGAARIEIIAGSKLESTGAVKVETIGGALIQETGSLTVDSGGPLTHTVGGTQKQAITGTHTITAAKAAKLKTTKLKLKAAESLTLKCGMSEIILDKDGILIKGTEVNISGDEIAVEGGDAIGNSAFGMFRPIKNMFAADDAKESVYNKGILIRGSTDFINKVKRNLDELNNTKDGKTILQELDAQGRAGKGVTIEYLQETNQCTMHNNFKAVPKVARVNPQTGRADIVEPGEGTASTIHHDPDFAETYAGGTPCAKPSNWLAHELIHASHNGAGTNLRLFSDYSDSGYYPDPVSLEEAHTIGRGPYAGTPSENSIRREMGYEERTTHASPC